MNTVTITPSIELEQQRLTCWVAVRFADSEKNAIQVNERAIDVDKRAGCVPSVEYNKDRHVVPDAAAQWTITVLLTTAD